jgi:hypothetical protein
MGEAPRKVSRDPRLERPYRTRLWHQGRFIDLGHFKSREAARSARELAAAILARDPKSTDTTREAVRNKLFFDELASHT